MAKKSKSKTKNWEVVARFGDNLVVQDKKTKLFSVLDSDNQFVVTGVGTMEDLKVNELLSRLGTRVSVVYRELDQAKIKIWRVEDALRG